MLNALRKAAGSWVAKLLFVLLIISFAAWGIGDYLRPSAEEAVARVGDTEITPAEYRREFGREFERLRQRFGGSLTQELALQLGLADQVLAQMIERRLVGLEAHELGIRIGDDLVRREIYGMEAFQDATGQFDRARFEQILFSSGLSEEAFVAILRGDLARGQLLGAVTAGVTTPAGLAEAFSRFRQEQRVAEILFLPTQAAGQVPEPTDADLAAFYEANKERYTAPEYRRVTAVLLRPEDLAAEMRVSEERLREAYDSRQAEFRTPESRGVSQLLFTEEAAARSAYERIAAGESFDAVAADIPSAQRTDLGTVHPGDLFPEAVDQAVFALPAPGVTEPVQSPLGWHLLNVSEITPAATIPFEQAQERLRQEIARELAVDALYDLSNQFQDALAGGATLEEAAQQLNLKPVEIAAVDHSGLDKAGAPAEGLPPIPVFLQTVFETAEGQVSPLGETPDGGYFALRVDAVEPQRERALDEVRDRVDAAWRAEQARKLALAEAEKLAEQARAGEELAAIAEARNLSVQVSPPFTRGTNRPADRLPASLVEKLFAAAPGAVVVDQMADGAIVARLTEIEAADPAADASGVAAIRSDLTRRIAADLEAQYASALQSRHGVTVNQAAIRRMF